MYTLLADWDGHGPGPWILFFPLIWIAVVFLVIFVLRRTAWRRGCGYRTSADHPLAVLGRRYAEGDIDAEEYRSKRAVLSESPRSPRDGVGGGAGK
ncbi:SHOCT domain-containing protein [Streptomyces sp. SP17BM10]|uniref:SHOCT domain-containing protein n=1 Tax=Streptomyces sp. SP17BM10 TaxID=3002530 RepID=UPI002E768C9F|nr:SHOCT domain-containing protein [Streptomyces sp. SP17BM10]MEE1787833.1 SHOCT domain-containing protein [Streptomyces sp. SP17BM10]